MSLNVEEPHEEDVLQIIIEIAPTGEPMIGTNGPPLPVLHGIAILELAKEKMILQYWQAVRAEAEKAALLSPKLLLPTRN